MRMRTELRRNGDSNMRHVLVEVPQTAQLWRKTFQAESLGKSSSRGERGILLYAL